MDIEHLSKSQIVLLTLLVSFVTSIATGIVTVSLMEQAPPSIAQSVNRIVERTVERVVPGGQTAAVVTRETTVVVKESDIISQAVERVAPSVVRLYASNSDPALFLGFGVVLDASGVIASDSNALGESANADIVMLDGTRARAFVTARKTGTGVALLQAATTTNDGKSLPWRPAAIALQKPVLGQTIIAFSGKSTPRISSGIVTALISVDAEDGSHADVIDTNIPGESTFPGTILANIDGEITGMSTGVSRGTFLGGYISSPALIKNTPAAAALEKEPTQ